MTDKKGWSFFFYTFGELLCNKFHTKFYLYESLKCDACFIVVKSLQIDRKESLN